MVACHKTETQSTASNVDSTKIIDSINKARTLINNEVKNKNYFDLLTGTYQLSHSMISGTGKVTFEKVKNNHDEYDVEGEVYSGKNYFKIKGTAIRVSKEYFNFSGTTEQSIQSNDHGKVDRQNLNKSFKTKDQGKTWKMQGMINSSGFVDDIYIKK